MDSQTHSGDAPTVQPGEQAVRIDVDADNAIGYASIQNSVPVVRSIRITNLTDAALEDLQVLVRCNPSFALGADLRFDRLASHETRDIAPIDLQPDHAFLSDLQETVSAALTISVRQGAAALSQVSRPIDVLAYDQWAGTRALPELLAAFSMPNNPAVDQLIAEASRLLRSSDPDLSMNGYQSKSREVVWKQVSALYSTLCGKALQYAEPPASFGNDGQKIRTPDRILDGRVATCLDLAMLFASCLEQAGLRPVVLISQGHAWVGVWLHQATFAHPLTDDVQAVRKRVETGEFLAFETTGVAQHASRRASLRAAVEQGHAHLRDEAAFLYAVDICKAREVQIRPLPSKAGPLKSAEAPIDETPPSIEPAPNLPPLDPATLTPLDLPADETPEGRLAKWKSKLLDLTLRNRLLNFKPVKATLQIVAPDLCALEDALSEGTEFHIKPLPSLMAGHDPRVAQVHVQRNGRSPLDDMALDALGNKELLARASQESLEGHLLALHSAARTGLEEGGANTLYLAIGFLKWTEAEKADSAHLAPILLVPVSMTRQSVRSGFRLARHDDEAIINPTLLQLLKNAFELKVSGLDAVPTDDKGIDVPRVLQAFRLATREIPKWEVLEQAHLGIFSFTKYLMWKDLQDRSEQLKGNRVVRHLIDHPGDAFAVEGHGDPDVRLDDSHRPQDIHAPLLSDSSQLNAICAVDAGRDLVLEGPPGTGKSQTITNLIAHSLAKGRTVLFVSEKMAALEVVHRRLSDIGLAPFCLELHSSKAKKAEVLQQLGKALEVSGSRTPNDWNREAERLAALRQELNALVDTLHREHGNGLTVFDAIGTCIANAGSHASGMPWADAHTHPREALDALRETARKISTLAQALPSLGDHPLGLIGRIEWSPSWQDALLAAAQSTAGSASALQEMGGAFAKVLQIPVDGQSMDTFAALDRLADILLAAPKVPPGLARQAHHPATRARVSALIKHGRDRQAHWQRLGPGWKPHLVKMNGAELQGQWRHAMSTWWPRSWFAKRGILSRLASMREDGKPPLAASATDILAALSDVNEEDQTLLGMHADAEALLHDSYAGVQTDWQQVEQHAIWATSFADAVVRLAGGDPAVAHPIQERLQHLVSDQRSLLSADGPVGRTLLGYRDAYRNLLANLDVLQPLAQPVAVLTGPPEADGAMARLQGVLGRWAQAHRALLPWCNWRSARERAMAQGLQGLVASVERGDVPLSGMENHFEFSYRNWWLKKMVDADPILRTFSGADHERKIKEFRAADTRFQKLTQDYIAATLAGKVPAATAPVVGADSEMGRLRRELTKQRRHMPVRQLVQGLPTLLPKLKPCLLMSPLSVAQYLDARHAQFDLVVFDEASQIPVWDAVGVIARGKQLVVVGDPKQLPPTNFFNRSSDSDSDASSADEEVEDLESILDECLGAGMSRLSLKWHYRSRHESLITFSNARYYDSQLVTFPSPVTDDIAVRFEHVHGVYDRGGSRTNRAEAEAIVNAIERHFLDEGGKGRSVGVVTFNQTQQSLIETLLDARRRTNVDLDKAIAQASHEPLFIKNLENVQGDERDIILFSITYGPDAAGKVTMNFGPLNGEGGHRRLNVAISRARERVVIFSTLKPEQIDLGRVRATGVRDLKHYLEFALRGPKALVEQSVPTGREPDSPFETAVIRMLRDKGWVVHPQVGCSGYRIDLGIVDPRTPGRYLLGIECDGRSYHSGATARDRDRLRQHVLEGLGWRIHRIWSTEWWLDPEGELAKLADRLQSLLEVGVQEEEALAPHAEARAVDPEVGNGMPVDDQPIPVERGAQLNPYAPATLPAGRPESFYEPAHTKALVKCIDLVIDTEGPVLEAVLFKRVARAWSLERTGARIVERLRNIIPARVVRTVEDDRTFYWPDGATPSGWSRFRVADSNEHSRRHIDEVALEEVAAIVRHLLEQAGSSSRQDLARTTCRLLGMARTPADAEARVVNAIEWLVTTEAAVVHGDHVRLRT